VSAHKLAKLLEKELGASIAIMNIAGGGGSAGVTWFMSAKPDGYKLLAT
jgi:tripartite-type tricarboxylate transporter receptor subunit TctC